MTTVQDSRDALDREVTRALGFLSDRGYLYLGTFVASTPALGEYLKAVFVNPESHREVKVSYLPPMGGYPDVLKVFVEDGKLDSFTIDDFLRHQGAPSDVIAKLSLSAYKGSFQERVGSCLAAAKDVMDDYLGSIVGGGRWIHVPIDWGESR